MVDTTFEEGEVKEKLERNYEVTESMKEKGIDIAFIAEITGLSENEIIKL
ncbi:MAG: hypothetical protein J0L94_00885 [Rhodothermia bacterium]|nr:hypothetical protein [Rhodothermia bacterium]